uniref:Uncharacterized protein n=1 Tax=Coccolithus braarudii TaxID=221442 RepID=A0A7S0Q6J3_9EUKA|mmetsp:Transcript_47684/g.101836  ORF Transcript_47684/g.101836 Transcript_47684/m.101836 type:complete len:368 (+) Transcript_47684:47-1150(+)|eukprot:CAMPEP_0183359948 /NCGR_PEP_ID=MMETSP0164_2-20130417/53789_1 /TAXON_ID=221442 /ORGANISM="Coccolithus pelagicus ssp braarudi, Strain PLY182g" /LENGTH=367 /DNA_ID=CAMNT_0025534177 /DNA_START=36 /DNA_END=1139 /DNA_ORIENTATION=+
MEKKQDLMECGAAETAAPAHISLVSRCLVVPETQMPLGQTTELANISTSLRRAAALMLVFSTLHAYKGAIGTLVFLATFWLTWRAAASTLEAVRCSKLFRAIAAVVVSIATAEVGFSVWIGVARAPPVMQYIDEAVRSCIDTPPPPVLPADVLLSSNALSPDVHLAPPTIMKEAHMHEVVETFAQMFFSEMEKRKCHSFIKVPPPVALPASARPLSGPHWGCECASADLGKATLASLFTAAAASIPLRLHGTDADDDDDDDDDAKKSRSDESGTDRLRQLHGHEHTHEHEHEPGQANFGPMQMWDEHGHGTSTLSQQWPQQCVQVGRATKHVAWALLGLKVIGALGWFASGLLVFKFSQQLAVATHS